MTKQIYAGIPQDDLNFVVTTYLKHNFLLRLNKGALQNFQEEGARKLKKVLEKGAPIRYEFDYQYGQIVVKTDQAMKTLANEHNKNYVSDVGGIDLSSSNMNLQMQNNGGEIKFHLDPAMLQQLRNIPGLVPVISNIQPMRDLKNFLGITSS